MKSTHLITVGKLKDKNLMKVEADYLKRIKNPKLVIHELKANATDIDNEGTLILNKINSLGPQAHVVTLTEFGREFSSPKFSEWFTQTEQSNSDIIFVICGAHGPGQDLLSRTNTKLSLSQMTMPHRLARIIFVEQFYRALTIRDGHPYHN